MAPRNPVGWLILILGLAVPVLLFHAWQSRLQKTQRQQAQQRVRLKPAGFPSAVQGQRLSNPLQEPAAAPPPESPVPESAQALPLAVAVLPAPALVAALAAPAFAQWRDPTLSPFDILRIEEDKIEKEVAKRDIEEEKERLIPRPKPKPSAEKLIALQGIIYVDAGNRAAIVNGEIFREGQAIPTKAGPVKVRGISPEQVQFEHGGKRFRRSLDER
jgi:hypothetical protein